MNRKLKRILAIVLSFAMLISSLVIAAAEESRAGKFNKNFTITGDGATDIVAVARAQNGKTGSELNYGTHRYIWCADFVSDCARLAGVEDVVPFTGGVADLKNKILNAGGAMVTNQSDVKPGDIILYYCIYDGYVHTGLVTDTSNGITTTEGNFNDAVATVTASNRNYFYHGDKKLGTDHHVNTGDISYSFVRPAYKTAPTHIHAYGARNIAPTCTTDGYTLFYCRCGEEFTGNETEAFGHDHYLSDIIPATCIDNGQKIYTCRRCGNKKSEPISAKEHSAPVWVINKLPTCTEAGEKVGYCTKCGVIIAREDIDKTNHQNKAWKVDYEPTIDAAGKKSLYCTDCGYVLETEDITLHTHQFGYQEVIKEPTCTECGEKGTYCKLCGAVYITEPISANGHTSDSKSVWVTTTAPTCKESGVQTCYCTDCGVKTNIRNVDALNHDEGVWCVTTSPTCTESGQARCICTTCAEVIGTKELAPLNHDDGIWVVSVPATCTESGEKTRVCTRCNSELNKMTVEPLDHDEGVWTVRKAATCIDEGEKVCNCTRCGLCIDSQVISRSAHDKGVWKIDHEATADVQGHMSLYCSVCNEVLDGKDFAMHEHKEGFRKTLVAPSCVQQGEGGVFCEVCGCVYETYSIDVLEHSYTSWYTNNNATHSKSCIKCHNVQIQNCIFEQTVVKPTCTTGGYTIYMCRVCRFSYCDDFTRPLNHVFSEWKDVGDGATHMRKCSCCEETQYANHQWSEFEFDNNSSFFKNGTKSRFCADCGCVETTEAEHTATIRRMFYYPYLFIRNILVKLRTVISLDWLFPWLTRFIEI